MNQKFFVFWSVTAWEKNGIKAVVGEAHCWSKIRANMHTFASPLRSSYTERAFTGMSSDQHGMVCRHTDSDSGLGRSTPPRRAASPGIGSMRHLTSPSGPGSLPPALMTSKKRIYDDGSSDISSTPSSMMDYNGEWHNIVLGMILLLTWFVILVI